MIKIGEKIKSLRKSKSISQETLAEYLSVSFQAVSKWETGAAMPDITLVPAIASFFGISTDELFDFNLYEIEKNVEKIVHEHKKYYDTDRGSAKCGNSAYYGKKRASFRKRRFCNKVHAQFVRSLRRRNGRA
ncbi:MAG: helix-turn-helix transcriptional regulator [Clostridia bacterium]|nr:helix-turn-helix transcriptional regulator [Clostridia bacterium]